MKITVTLHEPGPATFTVCERVADGPALEWPDVENVKEATFGHLLAEGRPLPAGSIDVRIDCDRHDQVIETTRLARRVARSL